MNYIVAASSSFSDNDLLEKKLKFNPREYDVIYAKKGSNIASFLTSTGITIKTFSKYNELDSLNPDETDGTVFWDGDSKNIEKLVNKFSKLTVVKFENATTKSFKNQVEKISNEKWKKGCKELVKKLPNYFWVVAASSSGKYHPKCDLGNGGLVRHSIMVATAAVDLVSAEIFVEDNEINRDMALIAGLFHDCLKQGTDCTGRTVFDHPILAANYLAEELKDYIEEPYLSTICDAVRTHMGKWTTADYAPDIILDKPTTGFQKLVHTADYMAARKYISGLEEWN